MNEIPELSLYFIFVILLITYWIITHRYKKKQEIINQEEPIIYKK